MDSIISVYVSLIAKLDEELADISECMQGDLLELYQQILTEEKEKISGMLRTLL